MSKKKKFPMTAAQPVITIKADSTTYEIFALDVGRNYLEGFGGSRHALYPKDTASIVIRERSSLGFRDTEYDIDSPHVWNWIAELIYWKLPTVTARGVEAASDV